MKNLELTEEGNHRKIKRVYEFQGCNAMNKTLRSRKNLLALNKDWKEIEIFYIGSKKFKKEEKLTIDINSIILQEFETDLKNTYKIMDFLLFGQHNDQILILLDIGLLIWLKFDVVVGIIKLIDAIDVEMRDKREQCDLIDICPLEKYVAVSTDFNKVRACFLHIFKFNEGKFELKSKCDLMGEKISPFKAMKFLSYYGSQLMFMGVSCSVNTLFLSFNFDLENETIKELRKARRMKNVGQVYKLFKFGECFVAIGSHAKMINISYQD